MRVRDVKFLEMKWISLAYPEIHSHTRKGGRGGERGERGVQRITKEEQITTVLLDLTRLSV